MVRRSSSDSRHFGDLNDPDSDASIALKNAKSVFRLDFEAKNMDTDPNIYFINSPESLTSLVTSDPFKQQGQAVPRTPNYTISEEGWKKVLVLAIAAGIGASFLVQATYFTKQLIEGEKEFDE